MVEMCRQFVDMASVCLFVARRRDVRRRVVAVIARCQVASLNVVMVTSHSFSDRTAATSSNCQVSTAHQVSTMKHQLTRCATSSQVKQAASLTERNNRLAHSRNCCSGKIRLWYLATSDAKSDVIFLLGNPDFL